MAERDLDTTMGLVQRIAARKYLRILKDADVESPAEVEEARKKIAEAGTSMLPALLDLASQGVSNGALEECLVSLINDSTLDRTVDTLSALQGPPADFLEKVLSTAQGFDPVPLFERLDSAGASRPRIERILRARGQRLHWETIRKLLAGATRDRVRVLLAILESRTESQAVQVVLPLLKADDPWMKIQTLRFLAGRAATEAGPDIVAKLDDRDPGVRREAVTALGAIKSSDYLPPLCQSLRDSDLQVSSAAIAALVAIGDPGAVRHLIEVLKDESEYARRGAVEVLNEVATPEAIQDLVRALQDEDWWVRVRAADALGALGGDRVVDAILSLVKSDDVFVRRYAIEILNSIPSERSVPALIEALSDTDWWVRERAIDALGKTGDPSCVGPLARELQADAQLASLVLGALSKIGGQTALEAIVGFLMVDDASVRELAGKTLRQIAKSSADPEIRKGAARALSEKGEASEWGRSHGRGDGGAAGSQQGGPDAGQGGQPGGPGGPVGGAGQKTGVFQAIGSTRIQPRLPEVGLAPPTGVTPRPLAPSTGEGSHDPMNPRQQAGDSGSMPPAAHGLGAQTPDGGFQDPNLASGGVQSGGGHPSFPGQPGATPSGSPHDPATTQRVDMGDMQNPSGSFAGGAGGLPPSGSYAQTPSGSFGTMNSGSFRTGSPGVSLFDYPNLPQGTVLLERYSIVRKIGEGGFGYVYLVMDGSVREEIILKILSPQISMDETMIQRFVHELKYNRRIVHPNVIRLYDFLELNPGHAISMEYFPSRDLGTILDAEKTIDAERLLRITEQICHGLKAAHDSGIVHRDMKPPNILIGDDERVKIVDFGLAAASDSKQSRVTKSGILVGTPQYMAPEQIRGTDIDVRTDIYSLGALLFECVTGEPPFSSENPVNVLMMHLTDAVPCVDDRCPGLPDALSWLINQALCKDPADRPQSIDEVLAELGRRAA
ncbi:MAG: HEAT repeat domain-containing protein [Candidatus Eisenbacteria bacterium]|uniref:non-specific serine/threonine protein kinase n=1 Tax=Eiseniibacteriota bacterium TaxID=2212470 RepID=A0A956N920_UNCEI|nr:HEAT repeat domain-containing protein [Candidatus Eisenbacteria bacterium]MCB9464374.1 HEAT repeat domain-containing protein [Candidatus Eisenbacteria bacterium]